MECLSECAAGVHCQSVVLSVEADDDRNVQICFQLTFQMLYADMLNTDFWCMSCVS